MSKGIYDQRYKDLVAELTAARVELRFSQQWVADQMNWSQQVQHRVESCQRRLTVVEFTDLARLLGIDPCRMVDQIPPSPPR